VSAARRVSFVASLLLAGSPAAAQDSSTAPAGSSSATPGLEFQYRSSGRSGPARALIDVSIQSQAADAEAVLWITDPTSSRTPEPALMSQGSTRWRVGPLDRFEAGKTRRVVLLLRPRGQCRVGAALWAEITMAGSWLSAEQRGNRTLGGTIADCSQAILSVDVVSVEQRK
jgi:hypothetical protein